MFLAIQFAAITFAVKYIITLQSCIGCETRVLLLVVRVSELTIGDMWNNS